MATKEHWDVDPWNYTAMWQKIIGQPTQEWANNKRDAEKIFQGRKGEWALEIGAGVGRLLPYSTFDYTWGLEWSPSLIAMSTHVIPQYLDNVKMILGDGWKIPSAIGAFDFVYSFTCFQHMPTLEMIQSNIRETYRVLKTGGDCRIQTVRGENGNGKHDGYVFASADDFGREFINAGFKLINQKVEGEWIWVTCEK